MPPIKSIDEMEIRRIVQQEIKSCFEEINSNVKKQGESLSRIEEALLGNDYNKTGLVATVQSHSEYIDRNKVTDVANRSLKMVEMFEEWEENGNWKVVKEIILNSVISNKTKAFFGVGSWAGIIAFVGTIITIVGWFSGWFRG